MPATVTANQPVITWEKLPDDFVLDDEPVDNLSQPPIAAALSEALEQAGLLREPKMTGTNVAICATADGQFVTKAPDWFYVPSVKPNVPPNKTRRSYTPHEEGEPLAIAMEFLSETDGGEYSMRPKSPIGKWYYYEKILQVPTYAIFEPEAGWLEVYRLEAGKYREESPDENNRYWIPSIGLFLGVWQGTKADRTGNWLRWWDETGQMLLWGVERSQQEREAKEAALQQVQQELEAKEAALQQVQQEREAKEAALQRAEQLAQRLISMGINPEDI